MVEISMVSAGGLGGHNQRQRRKELISYGVVAFLILFSFNLYQRGGEDIYEIGTAFSSLSSSSSSSNMAGGGGGGGSSGIDPNMKSSEVVVTTKNTAIITDSFRAIGKRTGTDKIQGYDNFESCVQKGKVCIYPDAEREMCRPWGHFYDTIYERWLQPYTGTTPETSQPIQLLEIGYYTGKGYEAYTDYLAKNPHVELHSMELYCDNNAKQHRWYETLIETNRLHCGDASDYNFLHTTWLQKMKRSSSTTSNNNDNKNSPAPPLKVVIDDGSHHSKHMAASLFFWFPRIEPGGIFVVEDIQPINIANMFRTHILPQVLKDVHWCGGTGNKVPVDPLCFPQLQPYLQGVHCEMHICVFVRNNQPSSEPDQITSTTPSDAFTNAQKCLFGPHE